MRRRDVLTGLALAGLPVLSARGEAPAAAALENVLKRWDGDPHGDLRAVVVQSSGALAAERYFHGETADSLHDMRSAGKSITSLLVGCALDRGLIHNVADPLEKYLPTVKGSAVGSVALADLLTMRSGLMADDSVPDSPGSEDNLDAAADPVQFLLDVKQAGPAGKTYVYNSLCAYAVGLAIAAVAGKLEADFARDVLFGPMGISRFVWATDNAGHTKGQGNLSLSARDMAQIGQMVLDGGYFGERRIVAADWIESSLRPIVSIGAVDPYADSYGYFWFSKTHAVSGVPVLVHFASGNGGNKIYVVPSRAMVVAVTSSAYGHAYGQKRSQEILLALLGV
jgi:CubicO group peptidase (beta-lactamase class C family)